MAKKKARLKKSNSEMSYKEKRETAVSALKKNGYSDKDIEKIIKLSFFESAE